VSHHRDLAGVRRDQGGQDPDDRGLTGAVRPEQRKHVALADAEVDAVEDDLLAVSLAQACHGNRCACVELTKCVHAAHARTLT